MARIRLIFATYSNDFKTVCTFLITFVSQQYIENCFRWQWLIGYNVVVIFLKTSFQILGCMFVKDLPLSLHWLVQLIGVGCVRKFPSPDPSLLVEKADHTGVAWDAICFGFLIIQRRIFNSYNFFHIVDDTKATTILASRGKQYIFRFYEGAVTLFFQEPS